MTAEVVNGHDETTGPTVAEFIHDWPAVWYEKLRRFAQQQLRKYHVPPGRLDVDDVVQHTWLTMHTTTKPVQHADRYAYKVAQSLISQAARDGRRFILSLPDIDVSQLADEHASAREQIWNSSVEHEVLQREVADKISIIKRQLTHPQRVAVEGTVEHRMPRAEVAAQLDVAVGTLSTHRARALYKLKPLAERMGLAALYAVAGFFMGSGILLLLGRGPSEQGDTVYMAIAGGGVGLVAVRFLRTQIERIKMVSARVGTLALLVFMTLAGIWAIWRFGIATNGLNMFENVLATIGCGASLMMPLISDR